SRDATVIVTATRLGQAFGQPFDRLALVQRRAVDNDQLTKTRRYRFEVFQCHFLVLASVKGPSRRRSTGRRPASLPPSSRRSAGRSCRGNASPYPCGYAC